MYSATPLGVLPPAFDRAGHRDELRDARREPGIGAERLRDVREWPERDEGAVAVERVEQQPSGTARVLAATHLGQVQHREVVDRRPPLLGEGVGALERCLAPAGDRRVGLAAEREQPDRVPDAGVAVGLAGPGDRDGVDHDVVPLEEVEQGHDVVERKVGVHHDVTGVGVRPGRRSGRLGALEARLTRPREHGEEDHRGRRPPHGAMQAGPRPTPSPGATTLRRVFTSAHQRPLSGTARNPPPHGFKPERLGAEREKVRLLDA